MLTRTLGNSGLKTSSVAFGAWAIGGWKWGGSDADASIEAIRAALDAGITLIDTAPVYGFGFSEELVGRAIRGRPREQFQLATKCGLVWDRETPTHHASSEGRKIYRSCDAESMRAELHDSLRRLGVDYIDLYQTHWPDPERAMPEVADTLDAFKRDGLVRAVGFCNAAPDDLAAAADRLDTDQERYSLLDREAESGALAASRSAGLAFLAYSPLAQGLLTGRIDRSRTFADTDLRAGNPRFSERARDAVQATLAPVKALARDRGVPTEQLVLAWTLQQPGVTHVLAGTRSAEQAVINAGAGSLALNEEELAVVDAAAAAWPGFAALRTPDDAP